MRLLLLVLILVAAPAAVSQTPPKNGADLEIILENLEGLTEPYNGYEAVNENGQVEKRIVVPPEVFRNERQMESLRKQGLTPVLGPRPVPDCSADYSDIDAEQKESDSRLRAMRDRVIPLQHQYEQELYYRDRREKRYEEKCGKQKRADWDQRNLDMTKQACKAIEVACKPVKHW
jgi:hypothetical protein